MSHTVYYVFGQMPKHVKIYSSLRDEAGDVTRNRQDVKVDFADYQPEVGKPTVDQEALDAYRKTHWDQGDTRHIAMLEVIPGGLCHVAAP